MSMEYQVHVSKSCLVTSVTASVHCYMRQYCCLPRWIWTMSLLWKAISKGLFHADMKSKIVNLMALNYTSWALIQHRSLPYHNFFWPFETASFLHYSVVGRRWSKYEPRWQNGLGEILGAPKSSKMACTPSKAGIESHTPLHPESSDLTGNFLQDHQHYSLVVLKPRSMHETWGAIEQLQWSLKFSSTCALLSRYFGTIHCRMMIPEAIRSHPWNGQVLRFSSAVS